MKENNEGLVLLIVILLVAITYGILVCWQWLNLPIHNGLYFLELLVFLTHRYSKNIPLKKDIKKATGIRELFP
jgi:hypothetical protein